jgi:hypothetical protein
VERGHGRSDHQDLHRRSQGKTRRDAHVYICSKEGAYFLVYESGDLQEAHDPPLQNGWQYIGQQRWSLIEIKPIWHSLIVPVPLLLFFLCGGAEADVLQAQRALAGRRSHDADIVEITRGLKKGQLEQITVELVQVSILGPNAAETAVMKKLYD